MSLDANKRRLITGADNGQLKMWNFSSGACIKTMDPKAGAEITGITCTQVVPVLDMPATASGRSDEQAWQRLAADTMSDACTDV